jgi:hypothetical protein
MATASGDGKGTHRPVLPFVAYAAVVVLLGGAGVALWAARGPSPAISKAAPIAPAQPARGLTLPPRPVEPEAAARSKQELAVPSPPAQSEASDSARAAAAGEKSEPPKTSCAADIGAWPADSTEQAKAIQILLRDLGLYSGTTYGTVGPATRAAIRKFQLAVGDAETGELSEILFESLKNKRCASPAP